MVGATEIIIIIGDCHRMRLRLPSQLQNIQVTTTFGLSHKSVLTSIPEPHVLHMSV